MKKFLLRYLPVDLKESIRIGYGSLRGNHPILIYSMGKVGSRSVYNFLKSVHMPNPIYHVHLLSHDWIKEFNTYFSSLRPPISPRHMKMSKIIRKELDKKTSVKWKVITLVREPIHVRISGFFQNVNEFHPDLIDNVGNLKIEQAIKFLRKTLINFDKSRNPIDVYFRMWFEKDFKDSLHIDVLAHNFNHENGFTIIREKTFDILVIRFEDLNECFDTAIMNFLHLNRTATLERANITGEKQHGEAYKYILENVDIPGYVCEKIYSLKYAKHFYTEEMINKFINKWSRNT